jgi:hypothetical protein
VGRDFALIFKVMLVFSVAKLFGRVSFETILFTSLFAAFNVPYRLQTSCLDSLSVEVPQPDYVCSQTSAFGHTNVMYGLHNASLSQIQGAFTENPMMGYRNGGTGLNLNAQFFHNKESLILCEFKLATLWCKSKFAALLSPSTSVP